MADPTDPDPSPPQPPSPGPAPDGSVSTPPASSALPEPDISAEVPDPGPNLEFPLPVAATSQRRANGDSGPSQPPSSSNAQGGPAQTRNNDMSASPLGPPRDQQAPQQPSQISFTPPAHHDPTRASQHSTSPSLVPVQRQVLCESGTASTEITPETVDAELDGIPPPTLAKLKRRLGMAGRDVAAMTSEEKIRLVQLARRGTGTGMRSRSDAPAPGVSPQQQLQGGIAATRVVQHAHPRPPASLYMPTVQSGQAGPMFDPPYPEFRDLHGFVIPLAPIRRRGGTLQADAAADYAPTRPLPPPELEPATVSVSDISPGAVLKSWLCWRTMAWGPAAHGWPRRRARAAAP